MIERDPATRTWLRPAFAVYVPPVSGTIKQENFDEAYKRFKATIARGIELGQ